MEDYSNSLKDITDIRKTDDRTEPLTKVEMKLYRKITGKLADDLVIIGVGDTSHKQDEKAVGGIFLFLANSSLSRAAPIFWKAKLIARVCHSSKDAEILKS